MSSDEAQKGFDEADSGADTHQDGDWDDRGTDISCRRMHMLAIPTFLPGGLPRNPVIWLELERVLCGLFKGFTQSDARGCWWDGKKVIDEHVKVYMMHSDDDQTRAITLAWQGLFPDQQEIGLYVTGPHTD